jgi:hypothetical protein
MQADQQ